MKIKPKKDSQRFQLYLLLKGRKKSSFIQKEAQLLIIKINNQSQFQYEKITQKQFNNAHRQKKKGIKQIMKSIPRQKSNFQKKEFHTLIHHHTTITTPIDQKYSINEKIFDQNKSILNYNNKHFNVRKLYKTQQSTSNSLEKAKILDHRIYSKIQNNVNQSKQKQHIKLKNPLSNSFFQQKLEKITHNLDLKRIKPYQPRFQTEHQSLSKKVKSPYLQKYKFKTINGQLRDYRANFVQDSILRSKQKAFAHLTRFEQQQLQKYEVHYEGQRRLSSLKQFTDHEGNAKISVGDSIAYRYEIQSSLGQGSFGQVFKSFDHKKKQYVALKIIKNNQKFNRQAKIQIKILETVQSHDQISHYNIIKLKHAFTFRGHSCLVFQLLHMNLYEFLRSNNFKGLPLDLIRRVSIQILQGLLFFQRFNIIHCDLKPENIMLKKQNKTGIKIIDVGSGTFQDQQLYTYIQSRFYRAPEIILGIRYSNKIDIWSLGCILCQLFIGYPIFPGENQQEQIQMLMEVLGVPPLILLQRGSRSEKFFDLNHPKIIPNSKGKIRNPGTNPLSKKLKGCQDKKFILFLERCLKWLPQQRFKPSQALLDEWILQGLPQEIRRQHIEIVNYPKFQIIKN